MSAFIATVMRYMKTVVGALQEAGLKNLKICVRGAAVSPMLADETGGLIVLEWISSSTDYASGRLCA